MQEKYIRLKNYLSGFKSVAVAFSGGVDSTLLLHAAYEALGDKAIAITVKSDLFPEREHKESIDFTKKYGIKHIIFEADAFGILGFEDNPENRCYLCKKNMFGRMLEIVKENGINVIVEGSNMDDNMDYRPGMQAVRELGILSPLRYSDLYKNEIRNLLKILKIPNWEKPSFACLASRFVYGEKITYEKLAMVSIAEQYLLDLGFKQIRVRIHDKLARIEIESSEMDKFIITEIMDKVNNKLKSLGFKYVTLDLQGYRSGSMNEVL